MKITTKTGIYDVTGLKVYIKGLDEELPEGVDPESVKYFMICESYIESNRQTVLLPIFGKANAIRVMDLFERYEKLGREEIDLRTFDMNEVDVVENLNTINETSDNLLGCAGSLVILQIILYLLFGGLVLWFLLPLFG